MTRRPARIEQCARAERIELAQPGQTLGVEPARIGGRRLRGADRLEHGRRGIHADSFTKAHAGTRHQVQQLGGAAAFADERQRLALA
jgi:hypothetical protein